MNRTCELCNKQFTTVNSLKIHKQRKIPCIIINNIENNNKFKCKDCNHDFNTNQSLQKHIIKTCPIIHNKKNVVDIHTLIQLQNKQIQKLSETVEKLKKEPIAHVQNIETQNQTNNIQNIETQNITINIIPFPKLNIKNEDILNPFLKENSAAYEYAKIPYLDKVDVAKSDANNQLLSSVLVEMVENIYSNPDNRNVYFLKKDKVMVYEDGENWCIKSLDNANRDVCGSVVEKCKSMRNNIVFPPNTCNGDKESIKETFRTLPSEYENNTSKILKNAKSELGIIFEANKDKLKNNKLI